MRLCFVAPPTEHSRRRRRFFADCDHDVHLITVPSAPGRIPHSVTFDTYIAYADFGS